MEKRLLRSSSAKKTFLNKKRSSPENSTLNIYSSKTSKKEPNPKINSLNNPFNSIIFLLDKGEFFKKENKESKSNNLSYNIFIQKNQDNEIFFYQYAKYNINDINDKIFCFRCCDKKCSGIININYKKSIENFKVILPHNISYEKHSYILYPTYGYQIYLDLFDQNKEMNNLQLVFNTGDNNLNLNENNFFKDKKELINALKNIDFTKYEKEPINISSNIDIEDLSENNNVSGNDKEESNNEEEKNDNDNDISGSNNASSINNKPKSKSLGRKKRKKSALINIKRKKNGNINNNNLRRIKKRKKMKQIPVAITKEKETKENKPSNKMQTRSKSRIEEIKIENIEEEKHNSIEEEDNSNNSNSNNTNKTSSKKSEKESSSERNIFTFFNSRKNPSLSYGREVYYKKLRKVEKLKESRIKWNEYIENKFGKNVSLGTFINFNRKEQVYFRYRPLFITDSETRQIKYCCLENGCEGRIIFDLKMEVIEETAKHNIGNNTHLFSSHPKNFEIKKFFDDNKNIDKLCLLREFHGDED